MEPSKKVLDLIEHRMRSIGRAELALYFWRQWKGAIPKCTVEFEGFDTVRGDGASLFIAPIVDAGVMHCRALLEFVGLTSSDGHTLSIAKRKGRPDDVVIESFASLNTAKPDHLDEPVELRPSLASVIFSAHKGVAHTSQQFSVHQVELLEDAFQFTPFLLMQYFYGPLNLKPPDYRILAPTEFVGDAVNLRPFGRSYPSGGGRPPP